MMVSGNKVQPISSFAERPSSSNSRPGSSNFSLASIDSRGVNDLDSISTINLEELSYLRLKPFTRLDPALKRLLLFLRCFGLTLNIIHERRDHGDKEEESKNTFGKLARLIILSGVILISGEVVYDINLRQSKLLAEQKRSTPLLTFAIVAYSWLTITIPVICDICLIIVGSHLFRFYSRTKATVCNGHFFGKFTAVDSWYYYLGLTLIAFFDALGQVMILGVWPRILNGPMNFFTSQGKAQTMLINSALDSGGISSISEVQVTNQTSVVPSQMGSLAQPITDGPKPRIEAYLLDMLLGESQAHSDLGVCIKIGCLMIQFVHSHAFFMIIILLAKHYSTAISHINENLDKYEFKRLLKQLIILRDSSEQISLMISIPFALITILVFMRQIALNGVFIQSTMQPFENWAITLQTVTCSASVIMVYIYCDGLQSASKQTHRLKTEQTVFEDNRGGNQSTYEFLDCLNRLSKSIRISFFNIIAINKSSLIGLYGHMLTLIFVTS